MAIKLGDGRSVIHPYLRGGAYAELLRPDELPERYHSDPAWFLQGWRKARTGSWVGSGGFLVATPVEGDPNLLSVREYKGY